ncbi:potassium-transporting ATPase subunit F [Thermogymnomonas acidicola]|nr:potassium-transporting ATPase subunit F [Thermogymnomonas acidicola]
MFAAFAVLAAVVLGMAVYLIYTIVRAERF